MPNVFKALLRAAKSQFNPSMLGLLLLPFLITLVVSALLLWILWEPISASLQTWMIAFDPIRWLVKLTSSWGWDALSGFIVPLTSTVLVMTGAMLIALLFIAAFGMPLVLKFLQREYPDVLPRGDTPWWGSVINAVIAVVVFVLMYAVSMPFWLIPPLFFVLPMLAWGWLNARLMRFDALQVHATVDERKALIRQHRRGFFGLGVAVALLSTIPPLFLIMPVFSALAFAHYALMALQQSRKLHIDAALVVNAPASSSPSAR